MDCVNPSQKVLIIEDDDDIRATILGALESEGYSVSSAANGAEGLEQLRLSDNISLILVDLMMPVMDGREFIGIVRQSEFKHLPVVVVSANADRVPLEGVSGVINKPFTLDHLYASVKNFCA